MGSPDVIIVCMRRKWDISTKQLRKKCAEELQTRLDDQGDSEFGYILAEDLIDIVMENLAPDIYNQALKDAGKIIQTRLSDLEIELETLKQIR